MRNFGFEEHRLDKYQLGAQYLLSRYDLEGHADFRMIEDVMHGLCVSLRAEIWGKNETVTQNVEITLPAEPAGIAPLNWWEAVKERFAPRWFLARFPVEYREFWLPEKKVTKEVTVDVTALYPGVLAPKYETTTVVSKFKAMGLD